MQNLSFFLGYVMYFNNIVTGINVCIQDYLLITYSSSTNVKNTAIIIEGVQF